MPGLRRRDAGAVRYALGLGVRPRRGRVPAGTGVGDPEHRRGHRTDPVRARTAADHPDRREDHRGRHAAAPEDNPRDEEISGFAIPQLTQEALAAQSARIDTVSGATYTSEGYLQSLQSALDKAGA